ncbi:hypothetical protein GCM10010172_84570 [Paractinoplanes ferrugineus]|uniref:Lipoprotein n=1 Tax=Paractinoplanes ferrugineus TaxID=113564 RepID=A0A919IYX3_9ACTN|nr:hypothetical protein [Actinoplanes ferrugineus]GIE10778.1 hypothetical protein Afe05nite_26180 [Actinoplanes ferrugineus]
MRAVFLTLAALPLALTACTDGPQSVAGDAGPVNAPPTSASAALRTAVPPSTAPPSTTAPSTAPPSAAKPSPSTRGGGIRGTDWSSVTLADLRQYGDVTFKNGKASIGADNCTMLPGGARPYYAEFLAEEPANSPITEDAVVLVACGSDTQQQMLVPVKLGYDRRTRQTMGSIPADPQPGPGRPMTFTSYSVRNGVIVTTVRKTDGGTETRRYRFDGGTSWERF